MFAAAIWLRWLLLLLRLCLRSWGMLSAIICFHPTRFCAISIISSSVRWWGTSINRFPALPSLYCCSATRCSSRLGPIRRMWPSHLALVRLIAATKSNVCVRTLASSWMDLPVILLRHLEFAPFSAARVLSSIHHASLPYVKSEQMAARYTLSFMPMGSFELNTWRSWPMRSIAMPILRRTSYSWLPSAPKIDPRHLNLKLFSSTSPSQSTEGSSSCRSAIFFSAARATASLPLKSCSSSHFLS